MRNFLFIDGIQFTDINVDDSTFACVYVDMHDSMADWP
jgi:hypothetical protein